MDNLDELRERVRKLLLDQHKSLALGGMTFIDMEEEWLELISQYTQQETIKAVEGVALAVLNKGENPAYHDRMMFEVSQKAPVLYARIANQVGYYKKLTTNKSEEAAPNE